MLFAQEQKPIIFIKLLHGSLSPPVPHPSSVMLCYYITHLHQFQSSKSVRNYISGVRFLHKQLGLTPDGLLLCHFPPKSSRHYHVHTTTHVPPHPARHLASSVLATSLGPMGPAMRVFLTFVFFTILMQSNKAPPSQTMFDPSKHTC